MIEAGDLTLRKDLQWLIDRGVISFSASTWPIPLSKQEEALAKRRETGLSRADVDALDMVNFRVAQLRRKMSYGIELSAYNKAIPSLGFESSLRAQAVISEDRFRRVG
ncbi:MAG: hypothetical protein LBV61_04060 [Burkholderiaceae bacterium]|jgi:hypothetical protein|nr:hypothetical protein [Burkholderiaceae bacterium]